MTIRSKLIVLDIQYDDEDLTDFADPETWNWQQRLDRPPEHPVRLVAAGDMGEVLMPDFTDHNEETMTEIEDLKVVNFCPAVMITVDPSTLEILDVDIDWSQSLDDDQYEDHDPVALTASHWLDREDVRHEVRYAFDKIIGRKETK
jgi:hypothetical protein